MSIEISQRIVEVVNKLAKFGYAPIEFKFEVTNLPRGTAGTANILQNVVKFSDVYFKECKAEVLKETVPHEICHLYVAKYHPNAKQYHGREFRSMMRLLGCRGDTYHVMKSSEGRKRKTVKRYVYTSAKTGQEVFLTPQKHTKEQHYRVFNRQGFYTYRGEFIHFTGKVKTITPKKS